MWIFEELQNLLAVLKLKIATYDFAVKSALEEVFQLEINFQLRYIFQLLTLKTIMSIF